MPYTFYLDKPGDMLATFEKLKSKLAATGGKLTGNEKEGFISADGVEGNYTVEADTIKITVTITFNINLLIYASPFLRQGFPPVTFRRKVEIIFVLLTLFGGEIMKVKFGFVSFQPFGGGFCYTAYGYTVL